MLRLDSIDRNLVFTLFSQTDPPITVLRVSEINMEWNYI